MHQTGIFLLKYYCSPSPIIIMKATTWKHQTIKFHSIRKRYIIKYLVNIVQWLNGYCNQFFEMIKITRTKEMYIFFFSLCQTDNKCVGRPWLTSIRQSSIFFSPHSRNAGKWSCKSGRRWQSEKRGWRSATAGREKSKNYFPIPRRAAKYPRGFSQIGRTGAFSIKLDS